MRNLIPFFILLILFNSYSLYSQEGNPLLDILIKKSEELITKKPKNQKSPVFTKQSPINHKSENEFSNSNTLLIPVVFHVVHKTIGQSDISRIKFEETLEFLNHGFNEVLTNKIEDEYKNIVGKSNIRFDFASKVNGCPANLDITYHITEIDSFPSFNANNDGQVFYDQSLKKHGFNNSKKVLNIWICPLKNNSAGYSTFPMENNPLNDGVVIDFRYFFNEDKYIRQWVINHEVGHYLGLYHIWGKSGMGTKVCSLYNDDFIEDTPKQRTKNTYGKVKEGDILKVCGDNSKLSNYQNFMDYSGVYGMFTSGQVHKMREQLLIYRSGLLSKNCSEDITNNTGIFTDSRDGQKYKWVKIGTKTWMTQNLNYVSQNSYCYENNTENCKKYGRLYNWEEALKVCPSGWRLSNKNDWDLLGHAIPDQNYIRSTTSWLQNKNGNNKSGLNIMPGGYAENVLSIKYVGEGKLAKFWLSNSNVFGYSRTIGGSYGYHKIPVSGSSNKKELLSCRCVKD